MNNQPIVVERNINAPAEKIWQAITDNQKMKQWYFDVPDFKAEVGCEFSFVGQDNEGVDWVHLCRVTEVLVNKKLSHTWRYQGYEGDSVVSWELFDEGAITRVKLTHTGVETFPPLPSLARENFVQGWNEITGSMLPRFVAATGL